MKDRTEERSFESRAIQHATPESQGTASMAPPPLILKADVQQQKSEATTEHSSGVSAPVIQRQDDGEGPTNPRTILSNFLSGHASALGNIVGQAVNIALMNSRFARFLIESYYLSNIFDGEIDHTNEAVIHYYLGRGRSVRIGPLTREEVKNSEDQQYYLNRIKTAQTSSPSDGHYGVNMEDESYRSYHMGNTPIHYRTTCNESSCTTTFTSRGDGFWDIFWGGDDAGSEGELGGYPYAYQAFSWQETYPNPGYEFDDNGVPRPIPERITEGSPPSGYYNYSGSNDSSSY